jgi:hypothetical protein
MRAQGPCVGNVPEAEQGAEWFIDASVLVRNIEMGAHAATLTERSVWSCGVVHLIGSSPRRTPARFGSGLWEVGATGWWCVR